ncbi:MAG TPA: alpha/beta fold hydrolase [Edaphobacter sp.]
MDMPAGSNNLPPQILIVPGLFGSGPEHWQSQWERQQPSFRRVEQSNWNTPVCAEWLNVLDKEIRAKKDNVILVGHSLGAVTIAHWALSYNRRIAGALLVAPSDTDAATFPGGTSGFAPMPSCRFPFASTVIASTNDPYMDFERTEVLAKVWGSHFVGLGEHGHISTADGFGPWPEGLLSLDRFRGATY